MEDKSYNDAGHHQVGNAVLRGNVQVAKFVVLLVIRRNQRTEETVQGQAHRSEAHNLDQVVEPVSRLVERQVSLMPQDGEQSHDEHEAVHLECFHGYTLSGFGCPHAEVQNCEAETPHEGRVCLHNEDTCHYLNAEVAVFDQYVTHQQE